MLVHPGAAQYAQFFTMTVSSCSILFGYFSCFASFLPVALSFDEDLVGIAGQPVTKLYPEKINAKTKPIALMQA